MENTIQDQEKREGTTLERQGICEYAAFIFFVLICIISTNCDAGFSYPDK